MTTMRYSLHRAIHHEYWLRTNIEVKAPNLIIQDCIRLRDFWLNKLTDEEKEILEREVVAMLTHVVTEEERLASIPYRGNTGRKWAQGLGDVEW